MSKYKNIARNILLLIIIFSFFAGLALKKANADTAVLKDSDKKTCNDVFHVLSDGIYVSPDKIQYNVNEPIVFTFIIKNSFNYPLAQISVLAQLLKDNPIGDLNNGSYKIDEFIVNNNFNLAASSQTSFKYIYTPKKIMGSGNYRLAAFLVNSGKVNVAGLNFLPNSYGGVSSDFKINGAKDSLKIDINKIEINNKPMLLRTFLPIINSTSTTVFKTPLINDSNSNYKAAISYKLYYWDTLQDSNILDSKTDSINVPANSSRNLIYTLSKDLTKTGGAYVLRISEKDEVSQSFVDLRVGIEGIKGKIDYAGLSNFPISQNGRVGLFACFHESASYFNNIDGSLSVDLLDQYKNVLSSLRFQGVIGPQLESVSKEFSIPADLKYAELRSRLYDKNNQLLDEVNTIYSCNDSNINNVAIQYKNNRLTVKALNWCNEEVKFDPVFFEIANDQGAILMSTTTYNESAINSFISKTGNSNFNVVLETQNGIIKDIPIKELKKAGAISSGNIFIRTGIGKSLIDIFTKMILWSLVIIIAGIIILFIYKIYQTKIRNKK